MKKFFYVIAAAALAIGLCSCNKEIENPTEGNFVGTWDLVNTEAISGKVSVNTAPDKEEYLVITKETITQWYDGSKTWEGTFKFENDKIYVNGTSKYTVVSISGKEMVLSYPGLLLVDEYREHYKKR
ncbi:MAG: hypothetical protein J6S97_02535 [Bacteroidales bacterium]|nr:hypothetical protein [Bacteroidales bacterium]